MTKRNVRPVDRQLSGPPTSRFPEQLETPRMVLTRPTEADLPDLMSMHTDPLVMATLGGLRTPEEVEAMHRRLLDSWEQEGFG